MILRLRGPFVLASVPLVIAALCLSALGIHESLVAGRVRTEVAQIREAGHPTDDVSMSRWHAEKTSPDGTKAWSEILRLVDAGSTSFGRIERVPYVGSAPIPGEIAPSGEWAEEAEVGEYLYWMRPVIDQIHEATEYPVPVWQPIEFQGFDTPLPELQDARTIIRLLSLETEHALYQQDAERALRALDSMRRVAAAFDWPLCMVCDLVQIAHRGTHQSMIRRSMATGIWNEDQLRRLTDQLGPPREVSQRWRDVIAGERAMMMASVLDTHLSDDLWGSNAPPALVRQWLFVLPSVRERLLQNYQALQSVAAGGLDELTQRAENLQQTWTSETGESQSFVLLPAQVQGLFLPAVVSYAVAIEREETSRRFALTALAIKRFQLQTGHWPENLSQLERVGLEASDWETVSGGRFGYEATDGRAYLWSYERHKESAVSSTRPPLQLEDGTSNIVVTTIH